MENLIPPILPDINQDLYNYIVCIDKLPIHQYEENQELWPRKPNVPALFHCDGSPLASTLKVVRNLETGAIEDFIEVPIEGVGETARNSTSLTRAPAPASESIRGNAMNFPFWPAGYPNPFEDLEAKEENILSGEILTVPPGFKRGLVFEPDGVTICKNPIAYDKCFDIRQTNNVIDIVDIVNKEKDFMGIWNNNKKEEEKIPKQNEDLPEEEEVLPKEPPLLKISELTSTVSSKATKTEWAVLLDCTKPIDDFEERIPEMAHKYKFDLDIFQKQAILQLEQHNHVFVAAHTSAGKTVVAEYAIALSQKHMTRTIYTSPIKALSNQKYRDFKMIFKDVGLITGDFQINQKAACLIMTTEILRSMLYCGSDVTRDLEFVIFDEVHYINDKERGHVWEQVLILLPAHVCVVLLSATVPNTMEFADWLGRTHQKKVYVVSTAKRPVPLQHYLYTGTGGSTKDNRFLLLNSSNTWVQAGYTKAKDTLPPPSAVIKKFAPPQEKTLWNALIGHLQKHDLLPVVAFTFSRAKCDQNADNLRSLDLTTARDKSNIHRFFEECIKSLKEPDRQIPQIVRMRDILQRGIGVHHSGVLPIIKEMVEMLFQNGLVKLLFATETFAMGVNMPARTVIFDSIQKHDGVELRTLAPAEYIQMAGRAGRRGCDDQGTVIILCKQKIPGEQILKGMMLGRPNQLTSQFRLTYGMVLSLLRGESLSVEGMMSRSFREADHQRKMFDVHRKLEKVEETLKVETNQEFSEYLQPLVKFFDRANDYLKVREEILPDIIQFHRVSKELTPGKLLLITHSKHINKLAILLSSNLKASKPILKVLVLSDNHQKEEEAVQKDSWYKMLALAKNDIYQPIGTATHQVLTISLLDIFEICSKSIKTDCDLILKDWDKRQMPRFKDDPPGQTCQHAVQDLFEITIAMFNKNVANLPLRYLDFLNDLKVDDAILYDHVRELVELKEKLLDHVGCVQIPNFEEQFLGVFKRKSLEDEKRHLKFLVSHASMSLYPDYESRLALLRDLDYVDSNNQVQLKGRVACEMGMNELVITELVLRNILTRLQPAEVAALLSSLVFQAKTKKNLADFTLTEELKNGIEFLKDMHSEITDLELKHRISNDLGRDEELHFGLVEVVYNWASDKPFAEIMELTDVQEGIIVRCIQQLNETICDVRNAARLIGDPTLQNKMEEASTAIKRDIVFAASLYTQREGELI
ncbi:superkiller complex protein 2 [Onthophagus taurus]|uniref:superkiller complex protein 2 n=1 Tax=Onthophagus taurus TaxID=166361 RepID=UPI0039BDCFF5